MGDPSRAAEALERDGFLVLGPQKGIDLPALRAESDRWLGEEAAGVRNLLSRSGLFRELARSGPVGDLARRFLGPEARPVKLTLFDKLPEANWKVPLHQDLTIVVLERREVPGFGPWSEKDGMQNAQPPAGVLEGILAIRLHLDDTPETNGALRVVPGSHRFGKLTAERCAELRRQRGEHACPVKAGGAMLMRPLLLHASSAASKPSRRRVLHFEFTCEELPGGLDWAD